MMPKMSHVPSPRFGCISFNLSTPSPTASPDALQCAHVRDHHDQHPCRARRVSGKPPLSLPSGTLCTTLTVCNFFCQLTIPCCSLLPVFLVLNSVLPHTGPKILAYVTYFGDLFNTFLWFGLRLNICPTVSVYFQSRNAVVLLLDTWSLI